MKMRARQGTPFDMPSRSDLKAVLTSERGMRWDIAVGLALLYGASYCFPLLSKGMFYLLPSIWQYIYMPLSVVVLVLAPLFYIVGKWGEARSGLLRNAIAGGGIWVLSLLAIKSGLAAADYPWGRLILDATGWVDLSRGKLFLLTAGLVGLLLLAIASVKQMWWSWLRLMSILGYGLLILSAIRIWSYPSPLPDKRSPAVPTSSVKTPRQVVWLIFDEMDYSLSLGDESNSMRAQLPNFNSLHNMSVAASHAYSPARDTGTSIPALLMGRPIQGVDFRGPSFVVLMGVDGQRYPVKEVGSICDRIAGGASAATVRGFALPYCQYFPNLGSCHVTFAGNAGRWHDGLTFFAQDLFAIRYWVKTFSEHLPNALWYQFDFAYRSTVDSMEGMNEAILKDGTSLSFIHVNLPHLPGSYAQKHMGMLQVTEPHAIYRQNLIAADQALGKVMRILRANQNRKDFLLLVSSDHWLRLNSPDKPRPVPFMAWRVNESQGILMSEPISTVHSADLVDDFLNGKITSQKEICLWWQGKPVFPTWIPRSHES